MLKENIINITTNFAKLGDGMNWPTTAASADTILKNILNVFLVIIGITAVIAIIVSAIRIITSNGNSEKVATARRSLIWSVVGLIIALLAGVIVNAITGALQ